MTTLIDSATGLREPALLGQTVVLIGGSSGIGLETARSARAEGAQVVLTGRDPERLGRAAADVGAQQHAAFDAHDPDRLDAFSHQDAVAAAWYRLQRRVAAHPLDVAAGVGEVGKHCLGLGGDVHTDLDHAISGHDRSLASCSASASSLMRPRPRRQ